MAYLMDTRDPRRVYELRGTMILGRDVGCDLVLDDPRVSRRHVRLSPDPTGGYRFVDLGSRAGTYLDGQRVEEGGLTEGSVLRLGDSQLRYVRQLDVGVPRSIDLPAPRDFVPIEMVRDLDRLRRDYERLRAAYEVSVAVGTEQRPERIVDRILEAAFGLLPAERGVVEVFTPGTTEPAVRAQRLRTSSSNTQVKLSRTLVEHVSRTRRGMISTDAVHDEDLRRSVSIRDVGLRSLMCVPLVHEGAVHGVMQLDCLHTTHAFAEEDLSLFTTIASSAALALANVVLRGTLADHREAERLRLHHVLEGLPAGVALVDGEGRVSIANPAGDVVLAQVGRFEGERLTHVGGHSIEALVQAGPSADVEVEVGSRLYRVHAGRPESGSGQAVLVLSDATERRRQEELAAQADRMAVMGQLAGGIAHDFNNLLTVIRGAAEFLRSASVEPDVVEEAVAVQAAGQRASRLVAQLLTLGRCDPVHCEPLDLSQTVQEMQDLLRRALGRDNQLVLELAPELPLVSMDRGHVDQLVMNLTVNAKDAFEGAGRLTVRTRRDPGPDGTGAWVRLEVEDDGQGMPPEVARRIFEPFYTTKPVGKGTGLGLATLYGIVQGAGGVVDVVSEVGRGTRFEILLPALTRASTSLEAGAAGPLRRRAG